MLSLNFYVRTPEPNPITSRLDDAGQINAPSCFGEGEVQEALRDAGSRRFDSSPGASADTDTGFTLPSLVRPPLLPIPERLGRRDEEDIARVEAFLTKVCFVVPEVKASKL